MNKDGLIYLDLINSLRTTQDVTIFTEEIEDFQKVFFESEGKSFEKAIESVNEEYAVKIMQTFAKNKLDINNRDTVENFLNTLKDFLKQLKIIRLVISFEPTHRTVEKIHNFVKENIGIGYILNIEISEDLMGGAIVIFNGKYSDSSLKKNIENAFANRRQEIFTL